MNRSATAITWSAKPCGTRGSPKRSDRRSTSRENTGRISGENHRSITTISSAVTMTSVTTMPMTP